MRSSLTGSSVSGAGAPIASGWKKFGGSFIRVLQLGPNDFFWVRYGQAATFASRFCGQRAGRIDRHEGSQMPDLKRFSAHQARLGRQRHDPLAHRSAAQRANAIHEEKTEP